MSIGPKQLKDLTAAQWKEVGEGIDFMTEFAKRYPNGVMEVITKGKEAAKELIEDKIKTLLQPLTNEIDQAISDITAELGINTAITTVLNELGEVLNTIFGFIPKITEQLGDTERMARNMKNLIGWLKFFSEFGFYGLGPLPNIEF